MEPQILILFVSFLFVVATVPRPICLAAHEEGTHSVLHWLCRTSEEIARGCNPIFIRSHHALHLVPDYVGKQILTEYYLLSPIGISLPIFSYGPQGNEYY